MLTESIVEGSCPAEIECAKCSTIWAPEVTDSYQCPECGHDHRTPVQVSMSSLEEVFGEVLYAYTRETALADGTLIDVATLAETSAGLQRSLQAFKVPMAATPAALGYVAEAFPQLDQSDALAEVLHLALFMASMCPDRDRIKPHGPLILHIGPGDNAEPVMTLMMPEDD